MEAQKPRKKDIFDPATRITKKSYIFFIKKPYNDLKKYKATHPDELSLTNIKLVFKHMFGAEKKGKKKTRPPVNIKALFFKILRYCILFGVIAGFGLLIFLTLFPSIVAPPTTQPDYNASYEYMISDTEVISFKSDLRAYATIALNASHVKKSTTEMRLYSNEIPDHIVLLNSRRDNARHFNEFRVNLQKRLSDSGLGLKELHISQLMHMPNTSMILVVPSGRVPSAFLGLDNPKFSISNLLKVGSTIIYVGAEFDSGVLPQNESEIMITDTSLLKKLEINYQQSYRTSLTDGFTMQNPGYSLRNAKVYHSGISVLKRGTGHLVVFPATLDDGWSKSGIDAAHDIFGVIRNITWLSTETTLTTPYIVTNKEKKNRIEEISTLFSEPYTSEVNLTAEFLFTATTFDDEIITKIQFVDFPLIAKGKMSHVDVSLPTNICVRQDSEGKELGCEVFMTLDLRENSQRTETMKIVAYRNGMRISQFSIGPIPTQIRNEKIFYVVDLPAGDYVLKLEDDAGYVYAQSFLHVPSIVLRMTGASWPKGKFTFEVYVDGRNIGKAFDLRNIEVSMDKRQKQVLNSTDGKIVYLFSGPIAEGEHDFQIRIGEDTQKISRKYIIKREWWDNPLYQIMFVVAIIIGVVGLVIKKPESVFYQLDVPDFPPLSKTKVPVSVEQIKQIFDSVNADYSWQYMPLRHGEIKNGFRKISYKGRSILISDYNLEKVLTQLMKKDVVRESIGFYGLTDWEKKSQKPLDYLAVFRSLRDVFLKLSVNFTGFGQRKDCDTLVSGRDRYYVHICTGVDSLDRVFKTLEKGKSILVFKDRESLDQFNLDLYSSDQYLVAIKMYIRNGKLLTGTPADIERLIQ